MTSLSSEIDRLLHQHYPALQVEGEVSQVHLPASGHAYLELRDAESVLRVVIWRTEWAASRYRPTVGARVCCRGRLAGFAKKGWYQLYAHAIEPVGEGELARELARRRQRLEADGLLDPRRKRPLPRIPLVIGLATSPTGAAVHDFLEVAKRRFPAARVLVSGCSVQGPDAAPSVIQALELLIEDGRADVLVVTRGGGSKEDLLPFHDEELARYLAMSPIPVVTAVGHQIDTTLSDLVADAAAATPTDAALLVLPDRQVLAQQVDDRALALQRAMQRALSRRRDRVDSLRARLRSPHDRLRNLRRRAIDLQRRLLRAGGQGLERRKTRLASLQRQLQTLSPVAVLDRGYAIVTGPAGIVRQPGDVRPGDPLDIRVARGRVPARVEDTSK